jgi:hypothetical protein
VAGGVVLLLFVVPMVHPAHMSTLRSRSRCSNRFAPYRGFHTHCTPILVRRSAVHLALIKAVALFVSFRGAVCVGEGGDDDHGTVASCKGIDSFASPDVLVPGNPCNLHYVYYVLECALRNWKVRIQE